MIILPENIQDSHKAIVNLHALLDLKEQDYFSAKAQNDAFVTDILLLKEKNALYLHKLFGASSEKLKFLASNDNRQGILALSSVPEVLPAPAAQTTQVEVPKHTRVIVKRKLEGLLPEGNKFPEHLPREEAPPIDAGPEAGEVMSTKVTETLCVRPSQMFVRVTRRVVRKSEVTGVITQPAVPETPLPRTCVDSSFLAHIIIMKFLWHLPLYRQEQMLRLQGIQISRDTLIRYVISVAGLLGKLYDELLTHVLISESLFADETPVVVQKNGKYTDSRFWPFLGDDSVIFIFAKTRAAKEIEPILKGFKGYLQVDGYTVYESLSNKYPEIILLFCWAHVRRKFADALKHYPAEANQALRFIQALYHVEALGKDDQAKRGRLRQKYSKKILSMMKVWLSKKINEPQTLPKSLLGEAIMYALNRWDGLLRYAENPKLSIDSNPVERAIRPVAIGRKNWLFCASETGAEAACVLYSLISTCKLQGINPSEYLTDVLDRINDHSQLKLKELLPHNWKPLEKNIQKNKIQETNDHEVNSKNSVLATQGS